jgi:hypothetical protein
MGETSRHTGDTCKTMGGSHLQDEGGQLTCKAPMIAWVAADSASGDGLERKSWTVRSTAPTEPPSMGYPWRQDITWNGVA